MAFHSEGGEGEARVRGGGGGIGSRSAGWVGGFALPRALEEDGTPWLGNESNGIDVCGRTDSF